MSIEHEKIKIKRRQCVKMTIIIMYLVQKKRPQLRIRDGQTGQNTQVGCPKTFHPEKKNSKKNRNKFARLKWPCKSNSSFYIYHEEKYAGMIGYLYMRM